MNRIIAPVQATANLSLGKRFSFASTVSGASAF